MTGDPEELLALLLAERDGIVVDVLELLNLFAIRRLRPAEIARLKTVLMRRVQETARAACAYQHEKDTKPPPPNAPPPDWSKDDTEPGRPRSRRPKPKTLASRPPVPSRSRSRRPRARAG